MTRLHPIARAARGAVALLALAAGTAAQAGSISGFQGLLDGANFTVGNTGTLSGAGAAPGVASFTATTLTLVGGDTQEVFPAVGCDGAVAADPTSPCRIQAVIQAYGSFSFDYTTTTTDGGGPAYDLLGVLVDGVLMDLTDPGGDYPTQSGSRSYSVQHSFGWVLNCTDCTGGNATATISNLSFVPEPGSLALVAGALAALSAAGAARRRGG